MSALGAIGFKAAGYQTGAAGITINGRYGFYYSSDIYGVASRTSVFGTVSLIGITNLVKAEPVEYELTGIVKELGLPVQRTIRMYRRDNGALMYSTISASDGTFTLPSNAYNGEHYVIALDDDTGTSYDPLIFDRLIPE